MFPHCPLPRVSLLQRPPRPHHRASPSPRGRRTPPRKPTPPAKRSAARQASPSPDWRSSRIGGGPGPARSQPPLSRRPARRAAPPTARGPPRTRGSGYRQVERGHPDLCPQSPLTLEIHSPQTVPPPKGLQDLRFPPPPSTDRPCPLGAGGGDEVLLCLPFH